MSEIKKQWYVIRAVGGKENKVKEYIENEVRQSHLENYISQVLIPTEKIYQIRNGKKVSKERVSYPGYVLVEAALVGEIPFILRNTPNVLGFLNDTKGNSMEATPLRPQEVSAPGPMQAACNSRPFIRGAPAAEALRSTSRIFTAQSILTDNIKQ